MRIKIKGRGKLETPLIRKEKLDIIEENEEGWSLSETYIHYTVIEEEIRLE